ncbi:hypothetical protein K9N50_06295 [bacterium]|nr:hypothetical protein [bacterium]
MAKLSHSDDHETVIKKYSELIEKNNPDKFRIRTSLPGGEGLEIADMIPDIVLLDKDSEALIAIEAETVSSVGSDESVERWKAIAGAVKEFQILLPKGTQARANRICKKLGIKVRFQEY